MYSKCVSRSFLLPATLALFISACGGGGGTGTGTGGTSGGGTTSSSVPISGSGIKGPLAHAAVRLYQLDTGTAGGYNSQKPLASAVTDAQANIQGLGAPSTTVGPYVLVVDGTNAVDLDTGTTPVIHELITVVSQAALDSKQPVYATPLSTLAFDLAVRMTSPGASVSAFATNLSAAEALVKNTFGFGMSQAVDLRATPPLMVGTLTTLADQQLVANYRAAIEAFAAMVTQMANNSGIDANTIIDRIALDLTSDGVINGMAAGTPIAGIDVTILKQNPMDMVIPNTATAVKDIASLMLTEIQDTTVKSLFQSQSVAVKLVPANLDSKVTLNRFQALEQSGPLIVSASNVVITGKRISNPGGPCLVLNVYVTNVVVENSEIGPCGTRGVDIHGYNNGITVRDNYIHDTVDPGVQLYEANDINVQYNRIEYAATGVYAQVSQAIDVNNNSFRNMRGPSPRGQAVQFNQVTGAGNRINDNRSVTDAGWSGALDTINIFSSSGLPSDPIQVNRNVIRGGGTDPSVGGIVLGDRTGAYIVADSNVLLEPGNFGIGVVSGHDIVVTRNIIFSRRLPSPSSNGAGVFVWNHYSGVCSDITVKSNQVDWPYISDTDIAYWSTGSCGVVTGWAENNWRAAIDPDVYQ